MSEEVSHSTVDVLAANAALESQLGQAHADLLMATADTEALRAALGDLLHEVRHTLAGRSTRPDLIDAEGDAIATFAQEHPGTALRDEVTAARAEIVYLREWLRDDLKISNADIDEALAKAGQK